MLLELKQGIVGEIRSLALMVIVIKALVNVFFASAVARDAGAFGKRNFEKGTWPVSGIIWAFATLVGGVLVALAYWAIHHSTLSKKNL